jgi:hypothetical protein
MWTHYLCVKAGSHPESFLGYLPEGGSLPYQTDSVCADSVSTARLEEWSSLVPKFRRRRGRK